MVKKEFHADGMNSGRSDAQALGPQVMSAKQKPRRRERNYLAKVEAELFMLWRDAKDMQSPDAEVTPTDMYGVMLRAERALKALGWRPKAAPGKQMQPRER